MNNDTPEIDLYRGRDDYANSLNTEEIIKYQIKVGEGTFKFKVTGRSGTGSFIQSVQGSWVELSTILNTLNKAPAIFFAKDLKGFYGGGDNNNSGYLAAALINEGFIEFVNPKMRAEDLAKLN